MFITKGRLKKNSIKIADLTLYSKERLKIARQKAKKRFE